MTPPEAFRLLALGPDANADQINAAFRSQAKLHHPDAGGDAEAFRRLKEAQTVALEWSARPKASAPGLAFGIRFEADGSMHPDVALDAARWAMRSFVAAQEGFGIDDFQDNFSSFKRKQPTREDLDA